MSEAWNSECFNEFLKPLSERRKIYPKTSQLLREIHNRLKQQQNRDRTVRQIVQVTDPRGGVVQARIASRAARDIGQSFQQQNETMEVPAAAECAEALRQQSTHLHDLQPNLVVPPVELLGVTRNPLVQAVIESGRHLTLPRQAPLPTKRCFRCGHQWNGPCHQGGHRSNSAEYCTLPIAERLQHWTVPAGYEVNDIRTKMNRRTAMRQWKRRKEELELPLEEPHFLGW
jgi:hypothetical protein